MYITFYKKPDAHGRPMKPDNLVVNDDDKTVEFDAGLVEDVYVDDETVDMFDSSGYWSCMISLDELKVIVSKVRSKGIRV